MTLPRAKKSFGQNFLVDRTVVRRILAAAEVKPGETVLEVGPGTGILTEALVAARARVIAIEADHDLIAPLRVKFGDKIELVEADILSLHPTTYTLHPPFKLIANIPYNITSDLLSRFLTQEPRPTRMVLMLQREVADRILAKPPDMSLLSVICQLYAKVKRVTNVPKGAFRPSPKVDSAVVRFDIRGSGLVARSSLDPSYESRATSPEPAIRLARAGFSSRRKQLHHNLAASHLATSAQVKLVLKVLGLPETARAETLTPEQWVELSERI